MEDGIYGGDRKPYDDFSDSDSDVSYGGESPVTYDSDEQQIDYLSDGTYGGDEQQLSKKRKRNSGSDEQQFDDLSDGTYGSDEQPPFKKKKQL